MQNEVLAAGMAWMTQYKTETFWIVPGVFLILGWIAAYYFSRYDAAQKRCIAYQRAEQESAYQAWRSRTGRAVRAK